MTSNSPLRRVLREVAKIGSQALRSVVRTSFFYPRRTLLVLVLVSVVATYASARLIVDSDLAALLPKTARSVVDLEVLSQKEQGLGYVTIVLQQGERDERLRYAQELANRLETLETIRYVEFERPVSWFEQRALYYLDVPRLERFADEVDERTQWEIVQHNPLYFNLEEDSGPPLVEVPSFEGGDAPAAMQSQFRGRYFEDAEQTTQVVLARPFQRATDLDFSRRVVSDVERIIGELNAEQPNAVVASLTGTFAKKVEQRERLSKDLSLSSSIALVAVGAFLFIHFRSLLAIFLVCAPLAAGLTWSFGLAAVLFGHLNILTAFMGAILLGLGIDHGIHLLGSYHHHKAGQGDTWRAIESTFEHTGMGVVASALTTAVVFFCVAFSDFRAFREFGLVAGFGTVLLLVAYFVTLPALIALFPNTKAPSRAIAVWSHGTTRSRLLPLVIAGVVLLGVLPISGLTFNANLSSLEDRSQRMAVLDELANNVLGQSQMPAVIMPRNGDEEVRLLNVLRERQEQLGETSTIGSVLGPSDVVPTQQQEKQQILTRIGRSLARIDKSWLKEASQVDAHERLAAMAKEPPFGRQDLPPEVRRRVIPAGNATESGAGFVLAYPTIDLGDGEKVTKFARQLREPAGDVPIASEALILADILEMIRAEAPWVLSLSCVSVWAVLWLSLGRFGMTLLPVGVGALTAFSALGITALLGGSLNYLNILMIPVLFGITVDGTIHVVKSKMAGIPLDSTLRAIAGCLLTTGFGFGSLLFTQHPGLRSLGALAVTQLTINAALSLFVVPAILGHVAPMEPAHDETT